MKVLDCDSAPQKKEEPEFNLTKEDMIRNTGVYARSDGPGLQSSELYIVLDANPNGGSLVWFDPKEKNLHSYVVSSISTSARFKKVNKAVCFQLKDI